MAEHIIIYIIIYIAGFVLIQFLTWLGLRKEPTAHGHAVGHHLGCIIGLTWPISIPFLILMLLLGGVQWLVQKYREKK